MLNGLDPVIIFQFKKLIPAIDLQSIPILASIPSFTEEPPIPVYLSERVSGLFIDTEDKNIDVVTDMETLSAGGDPNITQKGANSVVTINIQARKDSLGLALLSALASLCLPKVTSQEYSISYLHGPVTIFRGLLHSFSINQTASSELAFIRIELTSGKSQPTPSDPFAGATKSTGLTPTSGGS